MNREPSERSDGLTTAGLLASQAATESNARTYPRSLPLAIDAAEGIELIDVEGDRYIDCLAGAGSIPLGHDHPVVLDAIRGLLDAGEPTHTLDITTPRREAFRETLFDLLPAPLADEGRIQFCSPAGTDAVEASLKLMQTATGNRDVIAFRGAYHGMTAGSLALMGDTAPRAHVEVPGHVHHLPYPYEYRPPLGVGGETETQALARQFETALTDPESGVEAPAAVILEVVQGEGGSIPAPDAWLREVRRITREHDVPLIVDEIQTGIGRTGEMFAFEHADIVPDAVLLSKAVGGGVPLSVLVYHESYDDWEPGAHVGTFRGHQLGMAAGQAALEYIREQDLPANAAQQGDRLRDALRATARERPELADVRGRGLMLGVEVVDPDAAATATGAQPPDADVATAIQRACLDAGLVVERGGRTGATIRFLPPLIVDETDVETIATRFDSAVSTVLDEASGED
ncbi:MAG: diaminobutyrate--2-oxoglutarate transaminase family protein [Halobacteriaceae archaeon]